MTIAILERQGSIHAVMRKTLVFKQKYPALFLSLMMILLPVMACRALTLPQNSLSGDWVGTYVCNQGVTDLSLVINEISPSGISAVFNFSADASNPGVPSGSFNMAGKYDTSTDRIILDGTTWINRPAGYVVVTLAGTVSQGNTEMSGEVIGPNCTTFTLKKQ